MALPYSAGANIPHGIKFGEQARGGDSAPVGLEGADMEEYTVNVMIPVCVAVLSGSASDAGAASVSDWLSGALGIFGGALDAVSSVSIFQFLLCFGLFCVVLRFLRRLYHM